MRAIHKVIRAIGAIALQAADAAHPTRKARLRAVNCDLCAGSRTGPRCVYACPHDAAHRLTGEHVLELAEKRESPSPSRGFFGWIGSLFRGKPTGE